MMPPGGTPPPADAPRSYFNRSQLLWFGLLLSPMASVWLLASNFRRMDRLDLQRHTLAIGFLWGLASVLTGLVMLQRGGFSAWVNTMFGINLFTVLGIVLLHDATQRPWVEALREQGHRRLPNRMALIHVVLVLIGFVLLVNLVVALLHAFGLTLPIPELPLPSEAAPTTPGTWT